MARHEVALRAREEVAEGTMAFRFDKPEGFAYRAGQSVSLALLDPPPEPNGARRVFSLASAPYEAGLEIATRMRAGSAFKRALASLPPGAAVGLTGPRGAMTLHDDPARAAVFIAGGIGITPFLSMLRQAAHERLDRSLFLLYSNRRPQDAAYLAELRGMADRGGRFRLLARMTDAEGFVDARTIGRFAADAAAPVYYLAGPPAMVGAVQAILRDAGVPDADVRSERFFGY